MSLKELRKILEEFEQFVMKHNGGVDRDSGIYVLMHNSNCTSAIDEFLDEVTQ